MADPASADVRHRPPVPASLRRSPLVALRGDHAVVAVGATETCPICLTQRALFVVYPSRPGRPASWGCVGCLLREEGDV